MVGGAEPEAEEVEAADSLLEARLERLEAEVSSPFTETELAERERKFRYLKEFRKQKRLKQRLEREDEARETMRAEVERILREDAERSALESEGTMSEQAMMESAGVDISYGEDANGKLVKRRASARRKTSARRRARHPVTAEDRERIDRNTDRHTRAWYARELLKIHAGKVKPTKAEREALFAYGRLKGWNKKRQK
jgi:hypothetical protein